MQKGGGGDVCKYFVSLLQRDSLSIARKRDIRKPGIQINSCSFSILVRIVVDWGVRLNKKTPVSSQQTIFLGLHD